MRPSAHFAMMRLASQALPIGGYSYSQGLESAIDRGWIRDEATLAQWISDTMTLNVGQFEAPVLWACCDAINREQYPELEELNDWYLASRETSELHAETLQMGYSLLRLLAGLANQPDRERTAIKQASVLLEQEAACSLPMAWALAGQSFSLTASDSLSAWLWAWFENQIAAAIKALPMGQQAGQRMIEQLEPALSEVAQNAATLPRSDWNNFAPGLAMASSWHETQYSRLFRS